MKSKIRSKLDFQNVLKKLDKKNKRVFFKLGAYVKTTMQRSMRKQRKRKWLRHAEVHVDKWRLIVSKKGTVHFPSGEPVKSWKLRTRAQIAAKRQGAYDGGHSKPGEPPRANRDKSFAGVRNAMHFRVAGRDNRKVYIGPILKPKVSGKPAKHIMSQTVPEILNEGGSITTRIAGETIRAHIAPRPFVEPAREKGSKRFLELLKKDKLR